MNIKFVFSIILPWIRFFLLYEQMLVSLLPGENPISSSILVLQENSLSLYQALLQREGGERKLVKIIITLGKFTRDRKMQAADLLSASPAEKLMPRCHVVFKLLVDLGFSAQLHKSGDKNKQTKNPPPCQSKQKWLSEFSCIKTNSSSLD